MRRIFIPLIILSTFAIACGGDDGGSAGFGSAGGSGADFCDGNDEINEGFDEFETLFFSDDPDAIEDAMNGLKDTMDDIASSAPGEIRDDVNLLKDGFNDFLDVLADADFNIFAVDDGDPRLAALDSPEFDAAGDRVNAYCGVDDDSDSGVDSGSDEDPGDDGGSGFPGGDDESDDEFDGGVDANFMASILSQAYGIDEDTALCIVEELGLNDPTAIDPTAFGDPQQEVCGTTLMEIFAGAGG